MEFRGFVGPSYVSQSPIADTERCMNLLTEVVESPGGKAKTVLYPAPGLTTYVDEALGEAFTDAPPLTSPIEPPIRALTTITYQGQEQVWFAGGTQLYIVPPPEGFSALGAFLSGGMAYPSLVALVNDGRPATINWNGDAGGEIFTTSGGLGTIYSLSPFGVVTPVPDAGTTIIQGGFLDGFFLSLTADSTLHLSDNLDGVTWDPAQIAQRTAAADPWIAMLVVHRQLWLFGTVTTDVWWNAGTSPFPFAPIDGANLQVGILAPFSVCEVDNAPMWLGRNASGSGIVYRAQGYTPSRVSNHAVEWAIQHYDTVEDAIGWSYQQDGHEFYVLEFPSMEKTWVYDVSVAAALGSGAAWHERGFWETSTGAGAYTAYRPRWHTYGYGRHLVGDREAGAIYTLSTDVATDVTGAGIRRLRRMPHLSQEQTRLFFRELQIDLEAGLGLESGQGSDPQLMLRWSDDGGKTWSNEHWVSAGMQGAYKARAIWSRLGSARDRVFEVSCSDPVPSRWIAAYLTVEAGRS